MALSSRPRPRARGRPRVAVITDALSEATAQAVGTPSAPGNPAPVVAALRTLGYDPILVEFNGNLVEWVAELPTGRFQLAFNLCEGLSNQAAGEPVAAGLVELLGIPLTGASSDMLALCLRKDRANAVLRTYGVPVPEWILARPGQPPGRWRRFPAIVKPAAEDGSFGIGSDCVVTDRTSLLAVTARGCQQWDRMLVQRFVAGREFNLAIVGDRVLPHAEIDFSRLDPGLPSVVTYAAKWEHGSPEDRGTVPRCPARVPARLASRLTELADASGQRWTARIRPDRRPRRRPGHDVRHRREPEPGPRDPGWPSAPGGCRRVELRRPDRSGRRGSAHPRAPDRRIGSNSSGCARRCPAPRGGHALHPAPRCGRGPARAEGDEVDVTYWQESLRESVTTVDELVKRFGVDHIDQEAVQRAIDSFNLRITPEILNLVKEPDGPDLAAVRAHRAGARGRGRDRRLARRGRRLAGAEHHASLSRSRAVSGEPGLRRLLPLLHAAPQGRRSREDPAGPVRLGVRLHRGSTPRSATSSSRAAIR